MWLKLKVYCVQYTTHLVYRCNSVMNCFFSYSTYSKDHRFSLKSSVTSKEVSAEVRQLIGIKDDKPFSIKWLDVEGMINMTFQVPIR